MYRKSPDFELVQIADEFIAVPLGENMFRGVISLTEPAFFILNQMNNPMSKSDLIKTLTDRYDIQETDAIADIEMILQKFIEVGIVLN